MPARVLYTFAAGLALGVFLRSFVAVPLLAAGVLSAVALLLAALWFRERAHARAPYILLFCILLVSFTVGVVRMDIATYGIESQRAALQLNDDTVLHGVVVREPDVRIDTQHITVETKDGVRVLVITDPYREFRYGEQVRIEGNITYPEAFTTEFNRTFAYDKYLHARGVTHTILYPEAIVVTDGPATPRLPLHILYKGKAAFLDALQRVVPEPSAGLGAGLLLGEKQALGDEREEIFRETGIIHIVVLSGYNVALVVLFVTTILGSFCSTRLQTILGIAAIVLFALLVGPSPTVVRASIMASLILIAAATGETYAVLRGLVFAGMVMVGINPYLLAFDTGFQLSFVATAGLILIAPLLVPYLTFIPSFASMREYVAATLATQIAVLPILLYQIGQLSLVAVVVNVLVLPLVAPAMLATALAGAGAMVENTLGLLLGSGADLILLLIISIAEWFGALPFAAVAVPPFSFWCVPVVYVAIGYIVWRATTYENEQRPPLDGWTIVPESALYERTYRS